MPIKITRTEIWTGDILDEPGGLAALLTPLADAGADLRCVIARRKHDRPAAPQSGVVYLTPVTGKKAHTAAYGVNLRPCPEIATLRVEGLNKQGLGRQITQAIADAGINMRGLSAFVLGKNFVAYLGFDSPADADRATTAIKSLGRTRPRKTSRRKSE
jgi:hypothetical protein